MGVKNFSEVLQVKTMNTAETLHIGGLSPTSSHEIGHARIWLFKHGTSGGNERIRVKITSDAAGQRVLDISSWSTLSDISGFDDGDWLGWVKVDFNRITRRPNVVYHFHLEIDNYTRNGETYYLSVVRDYPASIYVAGATNFYQAQWGIQIFGYK